MRQLEAHAPIALWRKAREAVRGSDLLWLWRLCPAAASSLPLRDLLPLLVSLRRHEDDVLRVRPPEVACGHQAWVFRLCWLSFDGWGALVALPPFGEI